MLGHCCHCPVTAVSLTPPPQSAQARRDPCVLSLQIHTADRADAESIGTLSWFVGDGERLPGSPHLGSFIRE